MKYLALSLIVSLCFHIELTAQCDNPYYQISEGMVVEMTSYNAKSKPTGKSVSKFKKISKTSNGLSTDIAIEVFDQKNKSISQGSYQMECDNGIIKLDVSKLIPQESLQAFKDMDVTLEMTELELPNNLNVGQKLKKSTFTIKAANPQMPLSMSFDIVNREVIGKESITTSAGTFECYKITYDINTKMSIINTTTKGVDYIAEKVGTVKTENFKSNGKLISYTLLTRLEP